MENERLTPEETIVCCRDGRFRKLPVLQTIAHPPGNHPPKTPIKADLYAVELKTAEGSRWWGFPRAYIGSDLRMHVSGFNPRNELVDRWETPK